MISGADTVVRPAGASASPQGPPPLADRSTTRLAVAGLVVVVALFPLLVDELTVGRTARVGVLSLAVLGLVVVTGRTGLISLGHGAFVGLGAFAMSGYLDLAGLPFPAALVASIATCWAVGWLLGLPALRIRGIYLALFTLGLGVVFPALAKRLPAVTGGVTGRSIDATWDPPGWIGEQHTMLWRYYSCVAVCGLLLWLTVGILQRRPGRAMQAVRDDETAASSFGINLLWTKTSAFALSAALAGAAGALQVILFPYVSHEQYDVFLSLRLYAAAVIGGVAHVAAAVHGVAALIAVPQLNDTLGLLDSDVIAFGVGLVALTFLAPDGIAGWLARRCSPRSPLSRPGPWPRRPRLPGGR